MQWQLIETAPIKEFDKEHWFVPHSPFLLLTNGHRVFIGSYEFTEKGKGRWRDHYGTAYPTHWMPLPELPSNNQLEEQ